ncbi:MAG TPA: DUF4058 family protein [Pirellulales bacterium]|nr:DUF4058 family protein [Pirellulales bacterium]
MKSPFPGMDPYLELHWRDVHQSLVTYARDHLQGKLPGDLVARMEEQVYVEPYDLDVEYRRAIYPDVRITEHPHREEGGGVAVASATTTAAEPLVVYLPEMANEGYIEIRERTAEQRLVTVIEVLSPSNKYAPGRKEYRRKQRELRRARVSLVEIDLLRGGGWVMNMPKRAIPTAYHRGYGACVWRAWEPVRAELYRFSVRQPLPHIKIPLRKTDPDVPLDLQSLVDQCYANGRYDSLDYSAGPEPPFDEADAAWANDLLKSAGRR